MNELPDRILNKIQPEPNTGCWLWTGALVHNGYGLTYWEQRHKYVHRIIYEFYKGPIPVDLQLDHLCRVRCCVNPDHLEPVTPKVNTQRGNTGLHEKTKTHCKHGHEFTPANTRLYGTWRICRVCDKQRKGK